MRAEEHEITPRWRWDTRKRTEYEKRAELNNRLPPSLWNMTEPLMGTQEEAEANTESCL